MQRKLGKLKITTALLSKAIGLPETTQIRACHGEHAYEGYIELVVEDPGLVNVEDGKKIPSVEAININRVFKWGS